MYERRNDPPLSRGAFLRRLAAHAAVGALLLAGSLALGMAGYMAYEHLGARLAFLNAAMLLGGMGPVTLPRTPAGQLFAGVFALYAGLVFLILTALLLTPLLHRLLHRFHWAEELPDNQR
ncbi:MAG: hypothetical protein WKG32_06475 [Gemmatimonadaceae bacterium]